MDTDTPRRPIIYIAGPFRGNNDWERHCHVHEAEQVALQVWRMGGVALCPHNNTKHFDGVLPHTVWLEGDLELLRASHAILMLLTWQQSSGAKAEHGYAEAWGIPVFHATEGGRDALQRWIAAWCENRRAGVPI